MPQFELTLRPGESVMIGDNVEIKLTQIVAADKVLVGVDAPRSLPVYRPDGAGNSDAFKNIPSA